MSLRRVTCLAVTIAFAVVSGCKERDDKSATASGSSGAPAASASVKSAPLVAVSLLTLTNPFFKEMGSAMESEGSKLGYQVAVESGENDPARQKDQVKDFLVRKAAAIVLTPCDSRSIGTAIIEANQAGIPVFTADVASTAEGAKVVCHVATDNLEGGRIAGRAMVEMLGGKGNIAIVDHPTVESGMMRTKGFEEEIAKAPDIKIVAKLPAFGARDKAFAVAQDILQAHSDLNAIFAINDPTALGVIAALENAGRAQSVKVIGFDGQLEARRAVKDGKLYATVMQYPKQIGAQTIQSIAKYMAGEDVPRQILIPPKLYRQSDAASDPDLK